MFWNYYLFPGNRAAPVPALPDEAHRPIEDDGQPFMPCGFSARTPNHGRANLPGGPGTPNCIRLCDPTCPISTSCTRSAAGSCPRHSDSPDPWRVLSGCVSDYPKEEVFDEEPTRNTAAFPRFRDALAFRRGELVNYSNMAGTRLPARR